MQPPAVSQADYFSVRVPFLAAEGHERLTRLAAAGLPGIRAADLRALIAGVRRVDTGLPVKHFMPSEQRRHVLRSSLCQPLRQSLAEARSRLVLLHRRALVARSRAEAFGWLGEALHLIQDSYSDAHTQRQITGSGRHPIVYIRYYGMRGAGYPREHRVPSDPRDVVAASGGGLTASARRAQIASRKYLRMALVHLRRPRSPRLASELRTFLDCHLILARRRREPASIYRRCRP